MSRARQAGGFLLLAGATVLLYVVSRGKWSDPLIDSGREWIVPDALARGELLYRDVVYWFGPFTPYLHATFFRVFGSSFRALVIAGCIGATGVLAALFLALRQVANRVHSLLWTALAIPALVFMPNAGGAILGMGYRIWHAAGFGLLALALAVRGQQPRSPWTAFASGMAAGLAGLCRTEWGIAALLAAGLAASLRLRGRSPAPILLWLFGGFLIAFAGGLGFFLERGGIRPVLFDAPVLLFNLPPETRASVAAIHPSVWARGAAQMTYSAFVWVAVFRLVEFVAFRRCDPAGRARQLSRLGAPLIVVAAMGMLGGLPSGVFFSGAPLICAASIVLGIRAPRQPLGAALAGCGALGLLMSNRRVFFLTDGPYVAPPLLFAFVCAAGCLTLMLEAREPSRRETLESFAAAALVLLTLVAFAGRLFQYRSDDRVAIAGTDGMLSARPAVARQTELVAETIRRMTPRGSGLVVFPEGELLNFLSGRRNPVRHKLYLPGYVASENESEIVAELSRSRPAAVVIWRRPTGEYGRGFFGEDYGKKIGEWAHVNYEMTPEASPRAGPDNRLFWCGFARSR